MDAQGNDTSSDHIMKSGTEHNAGYWGPPRQNKAAIEALEALGIEQNNQL